jgi:hypothetical protein
MTLLRIVLIAVLLYYGIKLLAGWIFHSDKERLHVNRRGRGRKGEERYSDLTNQRIEDADYEEIDVEEKP